MSQQSRVRFRDLSVDTDERVDMHAVLESIMQRGELIMGRAVEDFEATFARATARQHCVGVSNGTAALYLSLRALGVGPGDEVVTSPMSWVATGNAVLALGGTLVFADVSDDFNMQPELVEACLSERTKVVLPVHFYGRMARMDQIIEVARRHAIPVLEDAAQAFGASLHGRPAGSYGDAAAFSLNPMKPLAALGEAGAIVTNDLAISEKIRSLRYLGTQDRETCVDPSLNFKIDTLQAAFLSHRMKRVSHIIESRNRIAEAYSERLRDVVTVPPPVLDGVSAYFDYTIVCQDRDRLEQALLAEGIEVKVRHRLLLTQQPGYPKTAGPPVPNAERLAAGILSLPIHEKLTADDVTIVVDAVRRFYGA